MTTPRKKVIRPSEPIRKRSFSVNKNTSTLRDIIENNISGVQKSSAFDPRKSKLMNMSLNEKSNSKDRIRTPSLGRVSIHASHDPKPKLGGLSHLEYGISLSQNPQNFSGSRHISQSSQKQNIFFNSKTSGNLIGESQKQQDTQSRQSGSRRALTHSNGIFSKAQSVVSQVNEHQSRLNSSNVPERNRRERPVPVEISMKPKDPLGLESSLNQSNQRSRDYSNEVRINPKKYEISVLEATESYPTSFTNNPAAKANLEEMRHDDSQAFYLPKKLIHSGIKNSRLSSTEETKIKNIVGLATQPQASSIPQKQNTIIKHYGSQRPPIALSKMQSDMISGQNTSSRNGARIENKPVPRSIAQTRIKRSKEVTANEHYGTSEPVFESLTSRKKTLQYDSFQQKDPINELSMGNTQSYTIGVYDSGEPPLQSNEPVLNKLENRYQENRARFHTERKFAEEIQEHPKHVETFHSSQEFKPSLTKRNQLTGFDQYYQDKGHFIAKQNLSTEKLISLIKKVNSPNMSLEQTRSKGLVVSSLGARPQIVNRQNVNLNDAANIGISTIPGNQPMPIKTSELGVSGVPGKNANTRAKDSKDKESLYMSSQLLLI